MSQEKPTVFLVVDGKQNFIAEINLEKGEITASNEFNVLFGTEGLGNTFNKINNLVSTQ